MNIHFKDKLLFDKLRKNSLFEIEFGSSLYGLKNNKSDKDIICIYGRSDNLRDSFLWEHHQLQYKDESNNIDYVFIDLHNFIRNLLSGDSTINFEILHTEEMRRSTLSFLYLNKKEFYSYNIIKSYLGLAKRDLKQFKKSEYKNSKKISHAYRGLLSALEVYSGQYSNDFKKDEMNKLNSLKENKFNLSELMEIYVEINLNIEKNRNMINKELDKQKIHNVLEISFMHKLDKWLNSLTNGEYYQSKKIKDMDLNIFYEALESGIKY